MNDPLGELGQIRGHLLPEHGQTLPGRAGEHHHMHAIHAEGTARGGAPTVFQHRAPTGQIGLLEVVGRHGAPGLGKVVPDALLTLGVKLQRKSKGPRHHLFGQVVAGGPQSPGGDEDVCPASGNLHRLGQAGGVVPHHGGVVDVEAQPR